MEVRVAAVPAPSSSPVLPDLGSRVEFPYLSSARGGRVVLGRPPPAGSTSFASAGSFLVGEVAVALGGSPLAAQAATHQGDLLGFALGGAAGAAPGAGPARGGHPHRSHARV
jgi:hypothetical protein